jgi:chain length determinant protein tyrosine kinase EpsG
MKPLSTSFPTIKRTQAPGPGEAPLYGKAETPGSVSSIGAILVNTGRLSAENAERISRLQLDQGKRFGEAAVELGLLTEDDVQYALSRQFDNLYLPADDNSLSRHLIAAYQPLSTTVEKLRSVRAQLMLRWFKPEARQKILAVMSPGKGEGRSFIAANLAIVFSQLGERTLLVDADLRVPCQEKLFKVGNKAGLSTLLAGRTGTEAIARISLLPGLYILPAGPVPPNPQELLGRPGFAELMQSLARDFDIIIFDTPASSRYAEAQMIAAGAGSALLLACKNRSSVRDVASLAHNLDHTGVKLVGAVLNTLPGERK